MLTEEVDLFSRNDQDVGCAPGLELNIKLSDDKPVQKNYAVQKNYTQTIVKKSKVIFRTY